MALQISARYGTGKVADLLLKAKARLGRIVVDMAIHSGHREAFEEALRRNGKKIVNDEYIDDIEKPEPNEGRS